MAYRSFVKGKRICTIKSEKCRIYQENIEHQISEQIKNIKMFNDVYDSSIHYLAVDYRFYMPILTKKGKVNKRAGDVDGFIKITQDSIFKFINADDAEIVSLSATKIHSDSFKIVIELTVRELDFLI